MKYNFLYVGANGFPFGLATIQRQLLFAKGLNNDKSVCKIICRVGIHDESAGVKSKGYFEGVDYYYSSFLPYRHSNFFIRTLNKFTGFLNEPWLILKYREKGKKNILFGVRSSFLNTIYYRLIAWILGFKYIIDINEAHSLKKVGSGKVKLNHYLFDNYGIYLCDEIIVISDFLERLIHHKRKNVKITKIPVICDLERIDKINPFQSNAGYFLYCASAAYLDTALFVIRSFALASKGLNLVMILSGSARDINQIKNEIELQGQRETIQILSDLEYDTLISYYKGAKALLIPLPETLDHKARFPHKIGEYAASGRPIISNKWGEVITYFSEKNALLANHYDVEEYRFLMDKVAKNELDTSIGENSHQIAINYFDYRNVFNLIINDN